MNSKTKIKIKSGVGFSDTKESGENIGQGTVDGAIISAANLDDGITTYFEDSTEEICYGKVKLGPLLYQDDIVRITTSRSAAQNGLNRMSNTMDSKLLDINTDKSVHLIIGNGEKKQNLKNEIENEPLVYK